MYACNAFGYKAKGGGLSRGRRISCSIEHSVAEKRINKGGLARSMNNRILVLHKQGDIYLANRLLENKALLLLPCHLLIQSLFDRVVSYSLFRAPPALSPWELRQIPFGGAN